MCGCQFKMCFHVFCKNHLDAWSPSQQNSSKDSSYKCTDYIRIISYMTNFQFKTMISIDKIPTMWEVLTTFFPGFGFIEGSVMETDIRVFSECRWAGRVLGKTPRQVCHAFPRVLLSNLCYFHPYLRNPEEMIQIDEHKFYPTGLVQPPTSFILGCSPSWFPVINVFF